MQSEDKITGEIRFVEEQLRALSQNRFNGIFVVKWGFKDGGISTTNTSINQLVKDSTPQVVYRAFGGVEIKNN